MDQFPYAAEPQPPPWPPAHGYPHPPQWPPAYSWEPGPPPSHRRSVLALALLAVIMVAVGAGVALGINALVHRGNGAVAASITNAVVDVNSDLGNGEGAAGTGIILTANGEVLTNNHVIDGALHVTAVLTSSGRTYTANVIGYDATADVAVIQLSGASGLSPAALGDSSKVQVGDHVTVVGNALGRGGPPAQADGTVTALDQTITATDQDGSNPETLNGMIEFSAGIQEGDSGGPLVESGKVVGMDTAGSSTGRRQASNTVGYAIPIGTALAVAHEIVSGGGGSTVQRGGRPLLGVDVVDNSSPPGALVTDVVSGGPADSAGIAPDDIITSVSGTAVTSAASLKTALATHKPGDTVTVTWIDDTGQQQQASVQLTTAPPQ